MIEAKREDDVVTLTMSVREAQLLGLYMGEGGLIDIRAVMEKAYEDIGVELCMEIDSVAYGVFDSLDELVDTEYYSVTAKEME